MFWAMGRPAPVLGFSIAVGGGWRSGGGGRSPAPGRNPLVAAGSTWGGEIAGGAGSGFGSPPGGPCPRARFSTTALTSSLSVAAPSPPIRPKATSSGSITGLISIGNLAAASPITWLKMSDPTSIGMKTIDPARNVAVSMDSPMLAIASAILITAAVRRLPKPKVSRVKTSPTI